MGVRSTHAAIVLIVATAGGIAIDACSSAPDTATAATTSGMILTGAGGAQTSSVSSNSASSSAGVGGAGGADGVGGGGDGGDSSNGGGGAGGECANSDPGEPNDNETEAFKLAAIDCADGDGGTIYGVLADGTDIDWFTYTGNKGLTCEVDGFVSIVQGAGSLRVCQYFECVTGVTQVTCPDATTDDMSPNGRAGCCGTSDFDVTDLNCKGTLENNINVYIRVDDPTQQAMCLPYTIAYHY